MSPLNILVVDDNRGFRESLAQYLHGQQGVGMVRQAKNGSEAIERAAAEPPDLVLLDISMPVMTGLEAVQKIKDRSPDSKIVLVTTHEEQTYRELGEMLSVDGFVSKKNLKRGLEQLLRQYRGR